jgi:large subunit ribosomal protein L4
MNKKERQLALFSLLSSKAKDSAVKVVESFDVNNSKTKELSGVFSQMGVKSAVVAVLPTEKHVFEGGRNIASVKVIGVNYLNPRDLLKYKDLVFTKASLEHIVSLYS